MSKAAHGLSPAVTLSKIDPTDWTRETFRAAHAMARRMIRDRRTTTAAAAWNWYLLHARRRFTTPVAWHVSQLAGRVVFEARTPLHARAGSVETLLRQGLVRTTRRPRPGNLVGVVPYRCTAIDRVRSVGLNLALGHDPLASGGNPGVRLARAVQLRQDRAARREVAVGLAAERVALEAGRFYAITPAGKAALLETAS